ncbi:MAG: type VI secretion system tip protein VgrG [Prolixibacteraceae bacterium]|nr:type VI secretion system tip protein VgrG [Prolixibacteraceae bacterium]
MTAKPKTSGLINCILLADGTELSASFEIISVTVCKQVNRIPYAVVTLVDGNPAKQTFKNSENDKFVPGKDFEIKAGLNTDSSTIFKGIITKIGLKVTNKTSMMTVECEDKAGKLTIDKQTKIYHEQKDTDIFKSLTSGTGVSLTTDSTIITHEQIIRYNSTAWDFLLMRAQANGMVVIPNDNSLSIKKPDTSSSPKMTLEFGTNVLSFETEMNAKNQRTSIETASWDGASSSVNEAKASTNTPDPGNISIDDLASKLSSGDNIKYPGMLPSDELKTWTDAMSMHHKMSKIQGTYKCMGISEITPGDMVEIKGMGNRFSDTFYVTGIHHEIIGGGWTTDIQVGLSAKMFYEQFNYQHQKAGGLLPAFNGLMCGKVVSITNDPNSEFRVKVEIPALGSEVTLWARYTAPDAGKARGVVFYPEVDDEVVLGFLDDDPRFPIILGSLFSSSNTPPTDPEEKNGEKGVYSKNKLNLLFNDTNETISIETPNKNIITVDNKNNEIKISDSSKNSIKLSSSGIDLSSASNLKINASGNIDIKATGNLKIDGANVDLAAQASFSAKGNAGANIESSAITVVKGSLVQIN